MASSFDLKKHLPYQSRFLEIEGQRMHYFDEGPAEAPAVILLHGNPTWSFYYRSLIAKLRSAWRVIAPDYIGCGLSDHPSAVHYRAVDRVRHLRTLLTHLNISRFSLVMHDWGGPIGSALAVEDTGAVEKLVYLNTTLTETDSLPAMIKLAAWPLLGKALTKHSLRFLKLMTSYGVCRPLPPEVAAGYYYPYRSRARRSAIWDFVADIPFDNSHPSYSEMLSMASKLPNLGHVPVLIVWGLKDPCFHRGMLNQVARHFPQAKVVEIAEASHLVLEDAPQKACQCITEFFCESPTGMKGAAPRVSLAEKTKQEKTSESGEETPAPGIGLYQAFMRRAGESPRQDAVIMPHFSALPSLAAFLGGPQAGEAKIAYRHVSCGALCSLIHQYERGLVELGLSAGDKVLMLVPPGVDFLALAYALMGRGAVPVLVDPGMGLNNLLKCISDCAPDALIGAPKAVLLRLLKPGFFRRLKFWLNASEFFGVGGSSLGYLKKFSNAPLRPVEANLQSPALVAFTSGATGTPKGVIFTNAMMEAQLEIFAETFGIKAGKKDMPLLPVFSLYGLALGVCTVFPPLKPSQPLAFDARRIARILDEQGIAYSFGSPTLWNKLAEYCIRYQIVFPALEKVFMAGCAVAPAVMQRVKSIAPHAAVCTPYGATEALPVTLACSEELLDREIPAAHSGEKGAPVGKPVSGVEVRIIKPIEEGLSEARTMIELPALQIGEIIVRGKNVSPAYLNRPDATCAAKLKGETGFWHRIGDAGYVGSDGALYYCGRMAHVVRCQGRVYYSVPLERLFDQHPKVRRSALVGLHGGRQAGLVVEPYPEFWPDGEKAREEFIQELKILAKSDPLTDSIEKFFFHPSFPVDARHNAKIFRDQLGLWASSLKEKT